MYWTPCVWLSIIFSSVNVKSHYYPYSKQSLVVPAFWNWGSANQYDHPQSNDPPLSTKTSRSTLEQDNNHDVEPTDLPKDDDTPKISSRFLDLSFGSSKPANLSELAVTSYIYCKVFYKSLVKRIMFLYDVLKNFFVALKDKTMAVLGSPLQAAMQAAMLPVTLPIALTKYFVHFSKFGAYFFKLLFKDITNIQNWPQFWSKN